MVKCPYCEAMINNNDERCHSCGEWFVEPYLDNFCFISMPLFIILSISLVLGNLWIYYICVVVWLMFNYKNFIAIAIPKDVKKLNLLAFLMILTLIFIPKLAIIVEIFLSYRLLRIIEKFSYKKYDSPITHHELGMIVFRLLYVVYFIDTFTDRVKDPTRRYLLEPKSWIKYSILFLIIFIGCLCFIGFVNVPFLQ